MSITANKKAINSFYGPYEPFYFITSLCTEDLLTPKWRAAPRTVAPVSAIYCPMRMQRSWMRSCTLRPLQTFWKGYASPEGNLPVGNRRAEGRKKGPRRFVALLRLPTKGWFQEKAAPKNTGKGKKERTKRLFHAFRVLNGGGTEGLLHTCCGYLALKHRAGRVMLWFPRKFVPWCPCDRRRCVFSGRLPPPKAL